MNRKRAERLLEWWADCMLNGKQSHGYVSHSAEFKMVSGGGFVYGSRPLYGGSMSETDVQIDNIIRRHMSALGRVRAIACFCPCHGDVRLSYGDRARIARCSLSVFERVRTQAIRLVIEHEELIT